METPVVSGDIRNDKGQFIKGVSGNPKGPGLGYKKKLNAIIEAIADTFDGIGGQSAFQAWAVNHKEQFYKMVLQLIPKEMKIEQEGGDTHIHISPEKVLIFQDIKKEIDAIDNGKTDCIHVSEGTGSNRT